MAAGAGGAGRQHDAHDRAFFAGLLVVIGLLGSGAALAHRTHLAHSSRPGDACPVTASGGLVGFDARTGAVRWTNVVPPATAVRVDEENGDVHALDSRATDQVGRYVVADRTIDAGTGAVTGCESDTVAMTTAEDNAVRGFTDPLSSPLHLGRATIVPWGDGIRATDPTNTGIWGVAAARGEARIGDDLIVSTSQDDLAGTARLDLATGEARWSVDERYLGLGGDSTIVLTGSRKDAMAITARNAATGDALWSTKLPWPDPATDPWNIDVIDLGPLVVIPAGEPGALIAIDSRTGRLLWEAEGGSPGQNWKYSNPGSVGTAVLSPDGETVVATVAAQIPDDFYD